MHARQEWVVLSSQQLEHQNLNLEIRPVKTWKLLDIRENQSKAEILGDQDPPSATSSPALDQKQEGFTCMVRKR